MPTTPPDPAGRSPAGQRAPRDGDANELPGSTGSHHPAAEPLSDLIQRTGSSRRSANPGSDILQMLGAPGASPIGGSSSGVNNSDDAPTVITRGHVPAPPSAGSPGTGETQLLAGRRLGHFELIEAIGSGGMAAVLKARDLDLDRIVALKILPPEAARDPESVTRFKQEARAAAMLDHENIARAYFCGEDQGLHFIAFEFVEGENLREMIEHCGTVPAAECVRYMIQLAAGLNHAAERNVVHRDIKPSNIIITPDGRAKIVDMGLARQMDAVNGALTQSGVTLGTFDYISPEQALDPRRADVRSDIYSLGCAFYHALTGRPPVPEGTAAKKLQAHQHIDPLDPRQINPAIPDDLAVILSRMMAKNQEERYQSPAELISHLKGAAERLKLSLDIVATDSAVQAVRASPAVPLEPPRLRSGWVIAAAAVVAVVVISISTNEPGSRSKPPPWGPGQPSSTPDLIAGPPIRTLPQGGQPTGGDVVVHTASEFARALADPKTSRVYLSAGIFDLTTLPEGVTFSGKEFELIGSSTGVTKVVLTAGHSIVATGRQPPGTLMVKAGTFTGRSLQFEIRNEPFGVELLEAQAFPTNPIGLAFESTAEVNLIDCAFVSHIPPEEEGAAIGVAASAPESVPIRVRITRCLFGHGKELTRAGVAVQVPARAIVEVDDSGFGPHSAAIQIQAARVGTPESPMTPVASVKLLRSSFMLESRCTAVAAGAPATVMAGYCVFAAIGSVPILAPASPNGAIVQEAASLEGARYLGGTTQKNAYFRVNPGADKNAVILAQKPWADPRPLEALAEAEPWKAFRLKLTDPAVFTPGDPTRVIGAQFHDSLGFRAYPNFLAFPPQPKELVSGEPRLLVWQPDARDDPPPRDTYSDLGALLKTARSGDTVLIRHSGPLPIESTAELKVRGGPADFRLTIKPYPGSKPVLTAPGGAALDQTLFRLLGGEVVFEGVQFFLKPSRPRNPQAVAAVTIIGGRGCTFRDCVFTLAEEDDGKVAVVLLADPDKIMAMDGALRITPEVRFDRCVLRGKGRGVWVPVSRGVRVEATNSLAALDGPLLLEEPAGKATAGARSALKLSRVTMLVAGPIVELKAGKSGEMMRMGGLVPLDVDADECLFAAVPTAGQPLVEFDGIEPTDVKTVVTWQVRKPNRYANFDPTTAVAIVRPGTDGSQTKEWDWNQWITYSGEPPAAGKPVGKVTFEKTPAGTRDLRTLKPADAAVVGVIFSDLTDPKPTDAGVDTRLLPVPWDEARPE